MKLTYTVKLKPLKFKSLRRNLNWSDLKNPDKGEYIG